MNIINTFKFQNLMTTKVIYILFTFIGFSIAGCSEKQNKIGKKTDKNLSDAQENIPPNIPPKIEPFSQITSSTAKLSDNLCVNPESNTIDSQKSAKPNYSEEEKNFWAEVTLSDQELKELTNLNSNYIQSSIYKSIVEFQNDKKHQIKFARFYNLLRRKDENKELFNFLNINIWYEGMTFYQCPIKNLVEVFIHLDNRKFFCKHIKKNIELEISKEDVLKYIKSIYKIVKISHWLHKQEDSKNLANKFFSFDINKLCEYAESREINISEEESNEQLNINMSKFLNIQSLKPNELQKTTNLKKNIEDFANKDVEISYTFKTLKDALNTNSLVNDKAIGLKNIGNTCFLNSLLQLWASCYIDFSTKSVQKASDLKTYSESADNNINSSNFYDIILHIMYNLKSGKEVTKKILEKADSYLKFIDKTHKNNAQEDMMHYFFNMLDSLKNHGFIDLFIDYSTACTSCNSDDMKLNFRDMNIVVYCFSKSNNTTYMITETCTKCGKNCFVFLDSFNVNLLVRLDDALQDSVPPQKILFNIENSIKKIEYSLVSFSVYNGNSNSGHYWAYRKLRDGSWWQFNDNWTTKVPNNELEKISLNGKVNSAIYEINQLID